MKDSIELTAEFANKSSRHSKEPGECCSNWQIFDKPALLERYFNNDISICLEGRIRRNEREIEGFYAVFCNLLPSRRAEASNCSVGILDPKSLSYLKIRIDADFFSHVNGASDGQGEPVFILDIEVMQGDKEMVIRRAIEVRLLRSNEILGGDAHALYVSAQTGLFKFFNRGANGERVLLSYGAALSKHKRSDKVMEARSQLVDNFSSQDSEAGRHASNAFDYPRIIKSIVLELTNDFIWFGVSEEGRAFGIESPDCFIGPLNFGPTAI